MSIFVRLNFVFCLNFASSFVALQRFEHPANADGPLSCLVDGDGAGKGFTTSMRLHFRSYTSLSFLIFRSLIVKNWQFIVFLIVWFMGSSAKLT